MMVNSDQSRYRVVNAGRRFGKSFMLRMIILNWAVKDPGMYWIVAPTFDQGKLIHWIQGFKQEIPNFMIADKNESELSYTLKNGSIIQIRSADQPDRLIGVKLKGLGVDEIEAMPKWDEIWQQCLRPTLTDYAAPAIFIGTPRGYNNSFYDLCEKAKKIKNWSYFHFTSYDNPFIKKEEIDAAKEELDDNFFRQEYLAEFTKYTGLVYKDFEDRMIKPLDFKPAYWIRGADFGFRNPTAMPFVAVSEDDVWHQTLEIYDTGLTNKMRADLLLEKREQIKILDPHFSDFEFSTADSEAAGDIAELGQEYNEYFDPVKKISGESKMNYVQWKIAKFSERIRANKFFISPECKDTINEFKTYSYSEKKSSLEVPIKENDHALDSLADLNSMYLHFYEPKHIANPEGTYLKPYNEQPSDFEFEINELSGEDLTSV